MSQATVNSAIGALEIEGFEGKSPRPDDHVLEGIGLKSEPQPFTQIGFPPPCNVGDDDVTELAGR
jgi:hypothetical protein